MAYRFLLEVPETLADDANTVVNAVPDAQVLLTRDSHGLGFEDAYVDLSIAAHSLSIVETLYRWLAEFGQPYPEIRLVTHDGRRVQMAKADASLMIAAIRRDQPWIGTSMPMIGRHEPKPWLARGGMVEQLEASRTLALDRPESLFERIDSTPSIAIHNLAPAEQFYAEVLDLQVVARARRNDRGELDVIEDAYRPIQARLDASEADYVFLENGPLLVTLQRIPRGTPLPYGTHPNRIQTTATPDQIATVKGRILMNGFNLLDSDAGVLSFADPFNVIWTISPTTAAASRTTALQG